MNLSPVQMLLEPSINMRKQSTLQSFMIRVQLMPNYSSRELPKKQPYLVVPQEALPWFAELNIPSSLLGVVPKPAEECQQAVWGWQVPVSSVLPHSSLFWVDHICKNG